MEISARTLFVIAAAGMILIGTIWRLNGLETSLPTEGDEQALGPPGWQGISERASERMWREAALSPETGLAAGTSGKLHRFGAPSEVEYELAEPHQAAHERPTQRVGPEVDVDESVDVPNLTYMHIGPDIDAEDDLTHSRYQAEPGAQRRIGPLIDVDDYDAHKHFASDGYPQQVGPLVEVTGYSFEN